MRLEGSL